MTTSFMNETLQPGLVIDIAGQLGTYQVEKSQFTRIMAQTVHLADQLTKSSDHFGQQTRFTQVLKGISWSR